LPHAKRERSIDSNRVSDRRWDEKSMSPPYVNVLAATLVLIESVERATTDVIVQTDIMSDYKLPVNLAKGFWKFRRVTQKAVMQI